MPPPSGNTLTSYAVTAAAIGVVMLLRWRRMSRARPLTLERLWILPAVYAAVAAVLFYERPPHGAGWLFCAGALAAGAALGWQRGRFVRIEIDPETHALSQTASVGAVLFVLAIVAVRGALRQMPLPAGAALDPVAVTDMLVALALGLFAAQRLEMYRRGRRLLRAARGDG